MFVPDSVTIAVGTTNTTPANTLLAADATLNRWFRGIFITNTTSGIIQLNLGIGTAAIVSSTNGDVAFNFDIPAKVASFPLVQWPGRGRKALLGTVNVLFGFASGAGLILTAIYDKSLAT
jgi:hypothetical protein